MIDLHAHVLPGLDHGPADWDEALAMCRIAVADGIATLAATPHVSETFPNSSGAIEAAVGELRSRLAAAGVPLAVVAGGDYHVRPDLAPENVLTLGGNGRYFLLEFPFRGLPPGAEEFVRVLVRRGLTPIVTHPERTDSIQGDRRRLEPLVMAGALVQVTAGSLLGQFGPRAADTANWLLEEGWVHLLASDAHGSRERVPRLAEGLAMAARVIGMAQAEALVEANPRAVLAGSDLV